MASLKQRIASRVSAIRERRPLVDHAVRTQRHYGGVGGSQQAGAVTYFAFLSFFPIMALAFFVIGYVSQVYPDAKDTLREAIGQVLPGIIGPDDGKISMREIEDAAGAVGLIGLAGVVYAGLGWLSGMRDALTVMFEMPAREQPNFLVGKVRDLSTLALIGLILIVSVAVSGFVSTFSEEFLDAVGLGTELSPVFKLVTVLLGIGANMLLFFAMFRLLAEPHSPKRSLWSGALLGALGFEVLKRLSGLLLASTKDQAAFQAFGIALILVVWMNYFSRIVLYAAAWAHTSAAARALRVPDPPAPAQGPQTPALRLPGSGTTQPRATWLTPFTAGGVVALGLAVLVRKRKEDA